MLQRLSGQAFQSFKHWAKHSAGMDVPEYFGEDTEEELLACLSKLTYHLKRNNYEPCRQFFTRWSGSTG